LLSYLSRSQLVIPVLLGLSVAFSEILSGVPLRHFIIPIDVSSFGVLIAAFVGVLFLLLFRQMHLALLLCVLSMSYFVFRGLPYASSEGYYLGVMQLGSSLALVLVFSRRDGYLNPSLILFVVLMQIAALVVGLAQPIGWLIPMIMSGQLAFFSMALPIAAMLIALFRLDGQRVVLFFAVFILVAYMQRSMTLFSMLALPFVIYVAWFAIVDLSQRVWLDKLTGIPGRARFDSDIRGVANRSWIVIVDVDHFKRFNDRFGHLNGDRALQQVAATLAQVSGARAYRFGGEEFVLLLNAQSEEKLKQKLSGVLKKLAKRSIKLSGVKKEAASVTASMGCSQVSGAASVSEVLKAADKALYKAKSLGRNRVEFVKARL